jgi:hypothetical protein
MFNKHIIFSHIEIKNVKKVFFYFYFMLKYFDIVLFLHQSTFDWSRQKPSTKFIPQKKPSELRMAFFIIY